MVVSTSTATLDIIQALCRHNGWESCRLDGSTDANKRQVSTSCLFYMPDLHAKSFLHMLHPHYAYGAFIMWCCCLLALIELVAQHLHLLRTPGPLAGFC